MRVIGDVILGKPNLMQLKIRHPNITGMAPLKIGSRVRPPAHFVNKVEITYNGKLIVKASLTFSVSMDPALRFFFIPENLASGQIFCIVVLVGRYSSCSVARR